MNYCIIGAARSGFAAAKLASRLGHNVFLTEAAPEEKFTDIIPELKKINCRYEFWGNSFSALDNCDSVIISPGVPPGVPVLQKARALNLPIISELEFAASYIENPIAAITGTNGKTTTCSLLHFILQQSGKKSILAGNIGFPLSDYVGNITPDTYIVLEVSSYQLEFIDKFRPNIAVILNITPDHISYHGSMENYVNAKFKISKNQTAADFLITNADDLELTSHKDIYEKIKSQKLHFSSSPIDWGIYTEGDSMIYVEQQKKEEIMKLGNLALPGAHNRYNSMAAAVVAKVWQLRNENIRDSLMQFQGVEHRLEFVTSINGVDYINDSKATNINATWFALDSYSRPIIWIAGGLGDNNDYSLLDSLVEKNVEAIITIGKEEDAIFEHYYSKKKCYKAGILERAIEIAIDIAKAGEIVLFTPACKSFDQFLNFEHRGETFKKIVLEASFSKKIY